MADRARSTLKPPTLTPIPSMSATGGPVDQLLRVERDGDELSVGGDDEEVAGRRVAGVDPVGEHVRGTVRQGHGHDVPVGRPLPRVPHPEDQPLGVREDERPLGADLVPRPVIVYTGSIAPPVGRMRASPESTSK